MRITLPDDLAELYQVHADHHQVTTEQILLETLVQFQAHDPRERRVVLTKETLELLETRLGGGHLKDEADLLRKVDRLGSVHLGGIRVEFTPAQKEELIRRAEKLGKPVKEVAQGIVEKLSEQFFWGTGL